MQNTKLLLAALAGAFLLLSGCESENEPAPVFDEQRHAAALEEFWGEQYDTPVAPAEDFLYHHDEELGGIVITNYLGDSAAVKVPEAIDGHPVLE